MAAEPTRLVPPEIRRMAREGRLRLSDETIEYIETTTIDVDDIENALNTGELIKKEKDEKNEAPWKYTVIGPGVSGKRVYCAGKIRHVRLDEFFVITAHWADER